MHARSVLESIVVVIRRLIPGSEGSTQEHPARRPDERGVRSEVLTEELGNEELDWVFADGRAAVVAHGSTLMTQDLDILYRVTEANVRRVREIRLPSWSLRH